ncbi:hypothetical protein METBIDRAFT_36263 [Metschnikowia bicuspidata var. bicuspidata NRRL YB-4993]|uniref:Micro-fibrillar-associated protein 1 C-terminal domain-containing protein n=1 Tax=Metschnikowia bicuspidata var. bicuspidata NRRL YB-4993 TaxID=869754 RepID=A0A1A0HJ55_9ASCO|nr:hypothetical protein METBIDRAFT_36263 [Metschnikowia bicuspidata var. bicuspidata NRRL YB-4993]OBA24031.1 hypothetical protein METBIDRAFT_36263 [Metschnikowia bicuspidata var. bicuspidata NRRL YB-4993]
MQRESDGGSGSGTGADSSADSSAGSGSDSDASSSGSDSALRLQRPVFVKKKLPPKAAGSRGPARAALAKAEHLQQVDSKTLEKVPFDGIDDRDDMRPEDEYTQWKLREAARKKRDALLLEETELSKEDAVRRKRGLVRTGPLPDLDENGGGTSFSKGPSIGSKLGAFYTEQLDEKLLKRDYKDIEGREDHSRPTKYKRA